MVQKFFLGNLFFRRYILNIITLIKINSVDSGPVWYGSSSCWIIPIFSNSLIETISEINAGNKTETRLIIDMISEKINTLHEVLEYLEADIN